MFFGDTETIGKTGPVMTIQYAYDYGPITLHNVFNSPVKETLAIIEHSVQDIWCFFNLTFDSFHLNKTYNILTKFSNKNQIPTPDEYYDIEQKFRDQKYRALCVKPVSSLDIYLHALKGSYQCVMERKPLSIRKVPIVLAEALVNLLNEKITFRKLFFARSKTGVTGWQIDETDDPEFVDIVLRFKASAAMKTLAADALNRDYNKLEEINELVHPDEDATDPNNGAWANKGDFSLFYSHKKYWENDQRGRKYAIDDIIILRDLYAFFNHPVHGDDDSVLAQMVGACRYSGYSINVDQCHRLKEKYQELVKNTPMAPREVKTYLLNYLTPTEALALTSTKKDILTEMEKWTDPNDQEPIDKVDDSDLSVMDWGNHPAAIAAHKVLEARRASKRITILDKLINTKRFYPDFRIIGAKSGRMSGTGGLNPQGIPKEPEFRSIFTYKDLAEPDFSLIEQSIEESFDAGDFSSFEITIADAVYDDPIMREELLSGKKFHGLFGAQIYNVSYAECVANKKDYYDPAKAGVFALLYGAQVQKLSSTLHVNLETAEEGYQRFIQKYVKVGEKRAATIDKFCSMRQPEGIGSRIIWSDPADYIETMFGFKRFFTLENQVAKTLFFMANNLPKEFQNIKIKVKRRDRFQTAAGAVCSALYACAFNIQAANMRAAANHEIQGTGSQITKAVQRKQWDIQPSGISAFISKPMQVHDEILNPNRRSDMIKEVVQNSINYYKKYVPLIGIDWKVGLNSWAEKP